MSSYYDPILGQITLKADVTEADLDIAGKLNPQIVPKKRFRKVIQGLPDLPTKPITVQKGNPYHVPAGSPEGGRFSDGGSMSKLSSTASWGSGNKIGTRVKVDDKTSPHHGILGTVGKQMGTSNGVKLDNGKFDWFNNSSLKEVVPVNAPASSAVEEDPLAAYRRK